jgi:hypothetical protein
MSEDNTFDEVAYLKKEVKRLRESLNVLTPGIDILLKRRGFQIFKKEPSEDLLLPEEEFQDDYYRRLHKYSFRLFLRDVIKYQECFTVEKVTKYATATVSQEYLDYIVSARLAVKQVTGYNLNKHVKSFGETLEWYTAEIFKREFGAEAVWGVKFKRPNIGGDYDVIAKFDGSLLYVEVKSSPPKQIYDKEISAFLDRVSDLSPEISVFLVDTELRMKDKIVPMFDNELKRRSAGAGEITRMGRELFQTMNRIYIINSKDNIVRNIETVLNWYFRR